MKTTKSPNPLVGLSKANWKSALSASHRGPRPGKQRVQKAPRTPSWKVKF